MKNSEIIMLAGILMLPINAFAEEYKILFSKTEKPFVSLAVPAEPEVVSDPQGWVNFFNSNCGNNFADEDAMVSHTGVFSCQYQSLTTLPSQGLGVLNGHVYLFNNNLANVDGLSGLTQVSGALDLQSNNLSNVNGLSSATYIGILNLYLNQNLNDISGLANVVVGGPIQMDYRDYNVKIPSTAPICTSNKVITGYNGSTWSDMPKNLYCETP